MSENTLIKRNRKDSKIDVKEVLMKYLTYLPFILLCLGIALAVVYIQLRYAVPTYSSSISILIKDNKKTSSLSDQVLGELSPSTSKTRIDLVNAMEVLKSTTLMQRVVNALQLNLVQKRLGDIKTTEAYRNDQVQLVFDTIYEPSRPFNFVVVLKNNNEFYVGSKQEGNAYTSGHQFTNKTGKFRILVNSPAKTSGDIRFAFQYNDAWEVAGRLARTLAITPLKSSNIVSIRMVTEEARKGRDILNQLVVEYNSLNVEDQNRIVENSIRFIDERLELLTRELGTVEERAANFSQQNEVVSMETKSSYEFAEANNYKKIIEDNTLQIEIINMLSQYINKGDNRYQLVPSNMGIDDITLTTMVQQYNQEILKRDELLKTVPESNPSVGVINSQVEKLRQNILEALSNLKRSIQNTIRFNTGRYNAAIAQLNKIPGRQLMFKEISRQQGIKEQLYLFLLQKREESAIAKASTVGGSQFIDPATSSGVPVSPNPSNMYRMAIFLGLGIPLGLIYLKDYLNNKVVTRQQVVNVTDCPILGEISHDKGKERRFVVGKNDRSLLAEQFRILRTNIQFLLGDKTNTVVMVTSSVSGEGKTFSSMNLAAVFAIGGKKTVVVEMDLRKPRISSSLNLGEVKGITQFVMGQANVEDIVVPAPDNPNLFIVPAGIIPPNPAELILDPKIKLLIDYLRINFDMVVIDMAPIGLVSDAKIIGKYADATIFIIRQRFTLRRQLEMINEMYENNVLPNMGIVTNDVKTSGANSYYGYHGYGYGYGYTYNYNYSNKEEKKGLRRLFASKSEK